MNRTGIDGYRDFLAKRDGEADLLNRRLANREQFFGDIESNPVRSAHPADRATFLRNRRRRRPEPVPRPRPAPAADPAVSSAAGLRLDRA